MTLQAGHVASFLEKKEIPTHLVELFDRLYDFIYSTPENVEVVHNFDPEVVRLLIAYHYLKGTLVWHSTEGEIDGLLMWYRCQDWTWDDIIAWKPDDKDGDSFFLAFLWSKPGGMRGLCLQLIAKVPEVITHRLLGLREKKDGPRLIEWSQKLLVRVLKNYGQKIRSSPDASADRREPEHGKIPLWLRLGGRPGNNGSGVPKKAGTVRKTVR
tara:strand:+ start:14732 stop:15367 length:636 start_codon:yes stop_codon:yes gene_type:complete